MGAETIGSRTGRIGLGNSGAHLIWAKWRRFD